MPDTDIHVITPQYLTKLSMEVLAWSDACPGRRYLLGVAGIPGSGKSTFASQLLDAIDTARPGVARLVPMDGFHLPDSQLEQMGLRSRKGSPDTFNAAGYVALLQQAQLVDSSLAFPIYDRRLHAVVQPDEPRYKLDASVRIVLTEGNYLLLHDKPWATLRHVLDQCWFLHTDPDRARRWLIGRHVKGGRSEADAQTRYEHNDGPNTWTILTQSALPDRMLCWP